MVETSTGIYIDNSKKRIQVFTKEELIDRQTSWWIKIKAIYNF